MRADCRIAVAVLLLVAAVATCRAQQITLGEGYPIRGETETVVVEGADGRPLAGAAVTVTYRPNSKTEKTRELPRTDSAGSTRWPVEDAGIVTLAASAPGGAPIASRNVAVRFGGMPGSGIAVMIVAGGLLFGGAFLGFVLLMRAPPHIPEREPPSM